MFLGILTGFIIDIAILKTISDSYDRGYKRGYDTAYNKCKAELDKLISECTVTSTED